MKNLNAPLFILMLFPKILFASGVFLGGWGGSEKNKDGSLYSTLMLNISQSGEELVGRYCYVTRNGNRIDCPDDNVSNMKGVVKDDKATVEFDSSFGGKGGVAELVLEKNDLTWHLISDPKGGDFYAPEVYQLTREESKLNNKNQLKVLSTSGFTITLVNNCGAFYKPCQNVEYYGLRNKDHSQIALVGRTIEDSASTVAKGMIFQNGNIEYLIDFDPLKLKVSQGDKVLVEQDGHWE
ncbi:hypothetical protein [Pantoea cypripedii]|uniref:Uncharacterized protein n=1 Tax=Pantoea cypripedii TaxID=55209 RepID=A0A1X1EW21_PANCY|nr:hypothetical protein [Pantoea cypripedii]MBP2198261.1 hypothetical protein [Pantoea cypripedii]ORM94083.1 hypothetical protein HA50_12255 [Pantoea cypripedii]